MIDECCSLQSVQYHQLQPHSHLNNHSHIDHFRRLQNNPMSSILRKDIQLFQDTTEISQMIQQFPIPIAPDSSFIIIPELLEKIEREYNVPLTKAQYVNLWDPVDKNYFNVVNLLYFQSINFFLTSPIYIRFALQPSPSSISTIPKQIVDSQSILLQLQKKSKQIMKPQQLNQKIGAQSPTLMEDNASLLNMLNHRKHLIIPQNLNDNIKMEENEKDIAPIIKTKNEVDASDDDQKEVRHSTKKRKDSECSSYSEKNSKRNSIREKRVKERQICYVKGKVDEWRNLYENGRTNEFGQNEKINLDLAAQIVGLSRKTLDDYYAQLRKAQKYGFNFEEKAYEKMGTLRKYVKKMQETGGSQDDSSENINVKETFNTPQLLPVHNEEDFDCKKISLRKFSENKYDLNRNVSTSSTSTTVTSQSPPIFSQQSSINNQISLTPSAQTLFENNSLKVETPFNPQQPIKLLNQSNENIYSSIPNDQKLRNQKLLGSNSQSHMRFMVVKEQKAEEMEEEEVEQLPQQQQFNQNNSHNQISQQQQQQQQQQLSQQNQEDNQESYDYLSSELKEQDYQQDCAINAFTQNEEDQNDNHKRTNLINYY